MPHGVGPPAQFKLVPDKMVWASTIPPPASNRIIDAPPATGTSEFDVYTQPPDAAGKQAPPSGAACHQCPVAPTCWNVTAMTRELKPAGNLRPFASGVVENGP